MNSLEIFPQPAQRTEEQFLEAQRSTRTDRLESLGLMHRDASACVNSAEEQFRGLAASGQIPGRYYRQLYAWCVNTALVKKLEDPRYSELYAIAEAEPAQTHRLVLACLMGSAVAWIALDKWLSAELAQRFRKSIAYRRVAPDAIRKTMEKLLGAIRYRTLDGYARASISSWAITTCKHEIQEKLDDETRERRPSTELEKWRQRRQGYGSAAHLGQVETLLERVPTLEPVDELIRNMNRTQARQALASLSDRRLYVFFRRYFDDAQLAAIAQELNVPLQTVKDDLHLGKAQLRKLLHHQESGRFEQKVSKG